DTLIPGCFRFPIERPTLLARLLCCEPLRLGAAGLMRQLRQQGCEVWVYTTSLRNPWTIWCQFLAYGVRLGGIVTADTAEHVRRLRGEGGGPRHCSKYPPAFGIDVLVDDLEGVGMEGKQFGFCVVCVAPDDERWAEKVLAEVGRK